MAKQPRQATDLVGLVADDGLRQRRKVSANLSFNASSSSGASAEAAGPPTPCHHRTTSSPSKLEGLPGPSPELLAELLRGSSERVARAPAHRNVSERVLYIYVCIDFLLFRIGWFGVRLSGLIEVVYIDVRSERERVSSVYRKCFRELNLHTHIRTDDDIIASIYNFLLVYAIYTLLFCHTYNELQK